LKASSGDLTLLNLAILSIKQCLEKELDRIGFWNDSLFK
jgi:hypothetical protein